MARNSLAFFLSVLGVGLLTASASAQTPDTKKWPAELVQFAPYKANPVFTAAKGQWDAKIRERGWIMREDGVFRLWYTGYDGSKDGQRMLGYATSPDGIAWTRHPKNPLARDHWVEDMMIVKHDAKYFMFAEGREDRAHMLVSDNGIDWKRVGQLDIRLKSGKPIPDGPFGTPTVWRENDSWHLFYERNDLGIWLATSPDLKVWTNVQDEPVMKPGPGDYDKDMIALNQIVKHKGRYYAYYHGSARTGRKRGFGARTSPPPAISFTGRNIRAIRSCRSTRTNRAASSSTTANAIGSTQCIRRCICTLRSNRGHLQFS